MTYHSPRRRGRPPHANRAQIIVDAAVRVLADEGSKGLTHRRVDSEAGLPMGSTVHYAPTRSDLFLAAARRLNEMSLNDLQTFAEIVKEKSDPLLPEEIAKEMVVFWRKLLEPNQAHRLRAEMAVTFSQEFRGKVRELFKPQVEAMGQFWQDVFARLGSRDPDKSGLEFNLWNRGTFYIMAACERDLGEDHYAMIEKWIVQMILSLIGEGEAGSERPPRRSPRRRSTGRSA